jgi:hypothetical protein
MYSGLSTWYSFASHSSRSASVLPVYALIKWSSFVGVTQYTCISREQQEISGPHSSFAPQGRLCTGLSFPSSYCTYIVGLLGMSMRDSSRDALATG